MLQNPKNTIGSERFFSSADLTAVQRQMDYLWGSEVSLESF
ncbi:hypothetical protein THIOSC15_920007 [uncultured Thiomicrorhabdus sp.]